MTTEKAIELLEELDIEVWNEDSDGYDYSQAIRMAIEVLKVQLSQESTTFQKEVKRKTGHWRSMPMACYGGGTITEQECSFCGEHQMITSNFCPHCGADMRGDSNGFD